MNIIIFNFWSYDNLSLVTCPGFKNSFIHIALQEIILNKHNLNI